MPRQGLRQLTSKNQKKAELKNLAFFRLIHYCIIKILEKSRKIKGQKITKKLKAGKIEKLKIGKSQKNHESMDEKAADKSYELLRKAMDEKTADKKRHLYFVYAKSPAV